MLLSPGSRSVPRMLRAGVTMRSVFVSSISIYRNAGYATFWDPVSKDAKHNHSFIIEALNAFLKLSNLVENGLGDLRSGLMLMLLHHSHQSVIPEHIASSIFCVRQTIGKEDKRIARL